MKTMTELALICGVCLAGVAVAEILPVTVPYSVVSMLILTALLYRKVVRPEQFSGVGDFFVHNMGIFFVPAVVGAMEHMETLKSYLVPFLVITLISTPVVYAVTAWTVQLCLRFRKQKGETHD
jgi:holin-like protein